MKTLSVIFTIVLLVLAHYLPRLLRQTGSLPQEQRQQPPMILTGPATVADYPASLPPAFEL